MPTFTAQTPDDRSQTRSSRAVVLTELIVVIVIIGMLTGLAMLTLGGVYSQRKFEQEAYAVVDVLKKAYHASAETDRRYAVVFDFVEGAYVLRQFASLDLQTPSDEEAIISAGRFSRHCVLDYVLFDDFMDTRDEGDRISEARFLCGRGGWQYGGKIVLRDFEGRPYSIVVNRLCGDVRLLPGDAEILVPVNANELRF